MSLRSLLSRAAGALFGPSGELGIIEPSADGGFTLREMDRPWGTRYPTADDAANAARSCDLIPSYREIETSKHV